METTVEGAALVVTLTGRVAASSCPQLQAVLLGPRGAGVRDIHLEASGVTAIDDAVFSVLLAAAAWLRVAGGRLSFTGASASVRRSLSALSLTELLPAPPALVIPEPVLQA